MHKPKKPQFKHPFDLEEDEDQIPIQQTYVSYNNNAPTVHNPLPFNPYEFSQESPKKSESKIVQKVYQPAKKPQRKPIDAAPFQPRQQAEPSQPRHQKVYQLNEDGDPPLLDDIGIDVQLIIKRMRLILKLGKPDEQTLDDPDLSGPILIALCFGFLLLLSGKIQFGDIYAIFVIGNILLYFLFNFMSQIDLIPLYNIMSTVGYALLPMLILGICGIFSSLKGTGGILLSLAVSGWASFAASNFIQSLMKQTQSDRKPLLIYPLFLFYVSFAMIIIF